MTSLDLKKGDNTMQNAEKKYILVCLIKKKNLYILHKKSIITVKKIN